MGSTRLIDSGDLSPRQARILGFVVAFIAEHGYGPSVRDIARAERLATSTVAYQLTELEAAGRITRAEKVARSLRVVTQ